MAATVSTGSLKVMWPFHITTVRVSTIDPRELLDIAHAGPSGAKCLWVDMTHVTAATSGDPVFMEHHAASDSTTNDTCRIVLDTLPGGDLAGAVIDVNFYFVEAASGGNRAAH
jgi:hypothetical protein